MPTAGRVGIGLGSRIVRAGLRQGRVQLVAIDAGIVERVAAAPVRQRQLGRQPDVLLIDGGCAAPRGVRKEELVEPYYRRLKSGEGVTCVLTSLEQGRTFVSYMPRWKVRSGDANYRFIKAC